MKNLSRGLMALPLACATFAVADTPSLWVGQHGLNASFVSGRIQGLGRVVGQNPDGFFRVEPSSGHNVNELKQRLFDQVAFILDGKADQVDVGNLYSLRDHIAYLKGRFQIETGRLPLSFDHDGADTFEQLEYNLAPRANPANGRIDGRVYETAMRHRDLMPKATARMLDPTVGKGSMAPAAWAYVGPNFLKTPGQQYNGPSPLSGRKNAVAVSLSNPTNSYVASAGGGIWGSSDNASTYLPKSDKWASMQTTCVAVDPTDPNIVYAGTGDYYGAGNLQTRGIMRSTDGGANWTNVGAADFGDSVVTSIYVVKNNTTSLVVTTAGPSGDIWRSLDSGTTWARTNAPDGDWQDIDSTKFGTLVACSPSSGVYFSFDDGATWTVSPVAKPAGSGGTYWNIAVSKIDGNRWYLITSNHKMFRTDLFGSTWVDITASLDAGVTNSAYNWTAPSCFVETGPNDAGTHDYVCVGLKTIAMSDDEGATFADVSKSYLANAAIGENQRGMCFHPTAKTQGWVVNDRGLYFFQYNEGANSANFSNLNPTFGDIAMNTVVVHPTSTLQVMGGTAGLGNAAMRGATGPNPWTNLGTGIGGGVAFDLATPDLHYTTYNNGAVLGYTSPSDTSPSLLGLGGGLPITPLVCGGSTGSTLIAATNGDIRIFSPPFNWSTNATGGGTIRTIYVSKFDGQRLYTGATNGDIYRSTNTGTSFNKADNPSLPNRSIGGIVESPFSQESLIVGLQSVGFPDVVYQATNGGVPTPSWVNISGSGITALPSVPVNDVARDPFSNVLYAGTDLGVFVSPDEGAHWYDMNAMGLPNVAVTDLWLYSNGGTNFLYAATYGRGIWRCLLSNRQLTDLVIAKTKVWGGQQNTVTVKLSGSAPSGCLVQLSDSSTNVSVPSSVVIPQGSTQVTFTTFSVNPAVDEVENIVATAYGSTVQKSYIVYAVPPFTYTPESPNIYGGNRFNATIDLTKVAPIDAVFTFSDNTANVSSPASAAILTGAQTKTVPLYTLSVTSATGVTISAKLANTTRTTPLTLQPRPNLSNLSLSPTSVQGGQSSTGTVTMSVLSAAGPQTVNLGDTSVVVTPPANVVVPNAAISQDFTITTNVVAASYNVTVKAQLRATVKTATLNVHP